MAGVPQPMSLSHSLITCHDLLRAF
uniref:Uncharacterized protein n=1 Tax=Anguilla anguilla TaxID=7936 RepID=A0A0E9TEB5_ANGAN